MKVHPDVNMCSLHKLTPNQEAPFDVPENDPGSEWPEHGVVKFDNYQVGTNFIGLISQKYSSSLTTTR